MTNGAPAEQTTVLVVEDEFLVRLDIAAYLRDTGLIVLEAANADEAIQVLEKRSDIRVVFTDINMPGSMDGLRLAEFVRNRWPPIKLIVASGLVSILETELPSNSRFIRKPYQGAQVADAIAELVRI